MVERKVTPEEPIFGVSRILKNSNKKRGTTEEGTR
jgi:hypothetical protein